MHTCKCHEINKNKKSCCINSTSKCIKDEILSVINQVVTCSCQPGVNYIKLEGITCIESANLMVFGISVIGNCEHYKQNSVILVSAPYQIKDKKLCVKNNFKLMANFDIVTCALISGMSVQKACALNLSDLCYDKENNTIIILTGRRRTSIFSRTRFMNCWASSRQLCGSAEWRSRSGWWRRMRHRMMILIGRFLTQC